MRDAKVKIFVVSLADSHARRATIASQLEAQGLAFEWVDAVLGRGLPIEDIQRYQKNQRSGGGRPYDITPGEIGCTLSHIEVYRRVVDQGLDGAVVLEDDVQLLEGFSEVVGFLRKRALVLPGGSIAILGGMDGLPEKDMVTHSLWNGVMIDAERKLLVAVDSWFWRTCSYYVDKSAASRLLGFNRDVRAVADEWNFFLKRSVIERIQYVQPWVASHPTGVADVSSLAGERNLATASIDFSGAAVSPLRALVRSCRRQVRRLIPNVRPRS